MGNQNVSMVQMDCMKGSLGSNSVLLTDNGHEFCDIMGIERSLYGGIHTKVFFCDSNRSDQKGVCEANHKLIRNIIPKGTPIDDFTQTDANLITNHINSYARMSLYGKCPYDIAITFELVKRNATLFLVAFP